MENRLSSGLKSIADSISEQQWFQELKGKWDELDPQSRKYVAVGASAGAALLMFFLVLSFMLSVRSLKKDYNEKTDLLNLIQSSSEKLRLLKEVNGSRSDSSSDEGEWPAYFDKTAAQAGVDKSSLTISNEKSGEKSDQAKESLFDLSFKHVNIKQAVRFAFAIENGTRPAKIRNLSIDAADPEGYVDGTISVSAFSVVAK